MTLEQLYRAHNGKVSDKWSIYLREYERIFRPYATASINFLEIGVQNGGSLEIWAKYFSSAKNLVGCDIDEACGLLTYLDPRVTVIVGDATVEQVAAQIIHVTPTYDLIIDDGSHTSGDIIRAFCRYFDLVTEGGIFVVEDLHCSYWKEFDGGLFDPKSSMSFFKRLADTLNHQHWGNESNRITILHSFFDAYQCHISEKALESIHSIEFINSMCVIRKEASSFNQLGTRFFAGQIDAVAANGSALHGSNALAPNQRENPQSNLIELPEEQQARTSRELLKANDEVSSLKAGINGIESEVAAAQIKLMAINSELSAARLEISQVTSERDLLRARVEHLSSDQKEKKKQIDDIQRMLKASQTQLVQMVSSRSWRATAPLRRILNFFKKWWR